MIELTPRDRELVALGAAMGSNCIACVEYHVPQARRVGLSEAQIEAAIRLADKLRQVPARKTLQAAQGLLASPAEAGDGTGDVGDCGCGALSAESVASAADKAGEPAGAMMGMMSRMIDALGCQQLTHHAAAQGGQGAPADAAGAGCACR